MIKLLYTGSQPKCGLQQQDSSRSLGGFVSDSPVTNDFLSNLFSDLSMSSVDSNLAEFKAIAAQNNSGVTKTNVKLWMEVDVNDFCDYQIAVVEIGKDNCDCDFMESISNSNAAPFYAEFHTADSGSKLNIGSVLSQAYFGVWIKRKLKDTINSVPVKDYFCSTEYLKSTKVDVQKVKLHISWD